MIDHDGDADDDDDDDMFHEKVNSIAYTKLCLYVCVVSVLTKYNITIVKYT